MFDQEKFNQFLLEQGVVKFFEEPITLVSGRKSYVYANCRTLLNTVTNIDQVTDFILDFIEDNKLAGDYFFGVPEGATKLADILNYKYGKRKNNLKQRLVMGRGKPKEHGMIIDKHFIGDVRVGDKVILVEDATTTGGSLLKSSNLLKDAGVIVVAAIVIVNRLQKTAEGKSVENTLQEHNIPFFCLTDLRKMYPLLAHKYAEAPNVLQSVKKEYQEYGICNITER